MVSKEDALKTFNSLLSTITEEREVEPVGVARNYKLIAVVVVVFLAVAGGAWWWIKRKGKVVVAGEGGGGGKSYSLTPSVKSGGMKVRPVSGAATAAVAAPAPAAAAVK